MIFTVSKTNTQLDGPSYWDLFFKNGNWLHGESIEDFHNNIMFFIAIVLFTVVWIVITSILSFRRQTRYSRCIYKEKGTLIELMWVVLPALLLLIVSFPTFKLLYLIDEVADPLLILEEGIDQIIYPKYATMGDETRPFEFNPDGSDGREEAMTMLLYESGGEDIPRDEIGVGRINQGEVSRINRSMDAVALRQDAMRVSQIFQNNSTNTSLGFPDGTVRYYRYSDSWSRYPIDSFYNFRNDNMSNYMSSDWITRRLMPYLTTERWEGSRRFSLENHPGSRLHKVYTIFHENPMDRYVPKNIYSYGFRSVLPLELRYNSTYYCLESGDIKCKYRLDSTGALLHCHFVCPNKIIPANGQVLGYWYATGIIIDRPSGEIILNSRFKN